MKKKNKTQASPELFILVFFLSYQYFFEISNNSFNKINTIAIGKQNSHKIAVKHPFFI